MDMKEHMMDGIGMWNGMTDEASKVAGRRPDGTDAGVPSSPR